MRRVGMPERVRRDAFVDAGFLRGEAHGLPNYFRSDRSIGPPAMVRSGEEKGPRAHPAVVLAERREERRAERNLAVAATFALLDPEHHAPAIDVTDFELACFTAPQASAIEREK